MFKCDHSYSRLNYKPLICISGTTRDATVCGLSRYRRTIPASMLVCPQESNAAAGVTLLLSLQVTYAHL